MIKEIISDIRKCFEGDDIYQTNQQVLGIKEMFRGVVVANWVAMPLERVKFTPSNKIIVKEAGNFYNECWNERYKELHAPECEKLMLREKIKKNKSQH